MDTVLETSIEEQVSSILKSIEYSLGIQDILELKEMIVITIFLKYLSDIFYLKREELLRKYHDSEVDDLIDSPYVYEPIFYLPSNARWNNMMNQHNPVYEHLTNAIAFLEHSHPAFYGLSEPLNRVDRSELSDHKFADFLRIIDQLSFRLRENNRNYAGQFIEELLKKLANKANIKGDTFYTPPNISRLLVGLLKPQKDMTIYDPAVGSGGMLVQSINWLNEQENIGQIIELYGQEKSYSNAIIAKINLIMHNSTHYDIQVGNTLSDPKYITGRTGLFWTRDDCQVKQFDIVLSNPPFLAKNWRNKEIYQDIYNRFPRDIPPKYSSESAFLMHMIASTKIDGKIGVIMPQTILFKGNIEEKIRHKLIEEDLIEAIIGLPPGLLYGTNIPICILILNKKKTSKHQGKLLFIDASNNFEPARLMNELRKEDISKIIQTFEEFKTNGSYSQVVNITDLRKNNYNLSVRKYADNSETSRKIKELLNHHADFNSYKLSDPKFVLSITIPKKHEDLESGNAIYIKRHSSSKQIQLVLTCPENQLRNYYRIEFNPDFLIKNYAMLYFQSELGRLILSHLPTGANFPILSKEYIESLEVPVPTISIQKEIVRIASKLELAKNRIDSFFSQLTAEPKQYKYIEDSTNSMVYSLSTFNDANHLKQLIEMGETRQMEFKQSFFANIDRINNTLDKKIEKDKNVQREIIKVIASFMNTEGGTLLIGVTDHGKIEGIEAEMKCFKFKKIDNYFQEVSAQLASRLNNDYQQYCKLTEVKIDGNIVIRIDCKPTPYPIFLDDELFFVRTDTSSLALRGIEMIRYIQNQFKTTMLNEK